MDFEQQEPRVKVELPEVDAKERQSGDSRVEVQTHHNHNEQQEPRVEAERQVQEQPQAIGGDQDEQQRESQQPRIQPPLPQQPDEQPPPPQQPDEQPPPPQQPQDPFNAANIAARRSHRKPLLWFGILSFWLLPGAAAEEKVVKYRCDTVPNYDANDASTCGGEFPWDSACFTLRTGALWQCFPKGQKTPTPCEGILLNSQGKQEFYRGECVFKGNGDYQDAMDAHHLKPEEAKAPACYTEIDPDTVSAPERDSCQAAMFWAKYNGFPNNPKWYEGSGLTQQSSWWAFQNHIASSSGNTQGCAHPCPAATATITAIRDQAAACYTEIDPDTVSAPERDSCQAAMFWAKYDGFPNNPQWYEGSGLTQQSSWWAFQNHIASQSNTQGCAHPCPAATATTTAATATTTPAATATTNRDQAHEVPRKGEEASNLRNLKWRWAEHKLPGVGITVPRMGISDRWNTPADRAALVKELEQKMQDPKAVAKQYKTRPVEFADVDYPERRRTFADFTKALDWLALASNIQTRDDL